MFLTHVRTNPARRSLTSEIGRELVYSTRYDAKRQAKLLHSSSPVDS